MSSRVPMGHISVLVIWVAIFTLVYLYFDTQQKPIIAIAKEGTRGEIVIPRSSDGHYYVQGAINGYPIDFMVDTGASVVAISHALARAANLPSGTPANFSTAGGMVAGEIVSGQTIEAGGIRVNGLSVSVGLHSDMALLGQNFLRKLDVIQSNDQLILRVIVK